MKKSCGMCEHFASSYYANWGTCMAPLPAWITEVESGVVYVVDSHPKNYAEDCDAFSRE